MRGGGQAGWLEQMAPVGEALAVLLAPHGEVAIHNLQTGRIEALWNPLSGRAVGDDSLLDELPTTPGESWVVGPYAKVLPDGRSLTCVSAVLMDERGRRQGLLCINLDRSTLDRIAALATSLLAAQVPRPTPLFEKDWREELAQRVHDFCTERALDRDHLNRKTRQELVAMLDRAGMFAVRGSIDLTASALGVSRTTVYTLLKEIRP